MIRKVRLKQKQDNNKPKALFCQSGQHSWVGDSAVNAQYCCNPGYRRGSCSDPEKPPENALQPKRIYQGWLWWEPI
ncbi:MAG: hypothetical protein H6510_11795 [Acidobacteria bacterium]|nr:hypothetical protein [Acidobacteriota bacterium]MCB9398489.1 hypothetical protein [Acidobacteriota bacterium]